MKAYLLEINNFNELQRGEVNEFVFDTFDVLFNVWRNCILNDFIVLKDFGSSKNILYRLLNKGIIPKLSSVQSGNFYLLMHELQHDCQFKKLKFAYQLVDSVSLTEILFNDNFYFESKFNKYQVEQEVIYSGNHHIVSIAKTQADYNFIKKIGLYHPFGDCNSTFALLAWYKGERKAALLSSFGFENDLFHHKQIELFGEELDRFKANSITINRILSKPKMFCAHRSLINGLLQLISNINCRSIEILDVMTYEYHPLFRYMNFSAFNPKSRDRAFYYFRDLSVGQKYFQPQDQLLINKQIRTMIQNQKSIKFWLAPVPKKYQYLILNEQKWAIKDHRRNASRWTFLEKAAVVFFFDNETFELIALGKVIDKKKEIKENYEIFPLWFYLQNESLKEINFSLFDVIDKNTYDAFGVGGIIPIDDSQGYELMKKSNVKFERNGMYVHPNPFLLHRTKFEEIKNRVFVVQSWKLKDSVLPIIKGILQNSGFTVTYSGDREGQVIFDDIWLQMNEAEIIIVDFTQQRPNVYLEYGMALVLGKPIIAITQVKEDLPSDTPQLKYIHYGEDNNVYQTLDKTLVKSINDTREDIINSRIML